MVDMSCKLMHDRIAHHASIQRETTKPLQTPVISISVDAESSASRAHVFSPSTSHRRQMSHTHASRLPSFRRRHVSPIQAHEAPKVP